MTPLYVLQRLYFSSLHFGINLSSITKQDRNLVLSYLATYANEGQYLYTQEEAANVRSLPIFETTSEEFVTIENGVFYIFRGNIPFFKPTSNQFLKSMFLPFYKFLGVKELNQSDVFMLFIMPQLPAMSFDER